MARTSITIVLELDEAVDSPRGSARLPDGTCRTFHGWLGLAEAVDVSAGISARSGATPPCDSRNRGANGQPETQCEKGARK